MSAATLEPIEFREAGDPGASIWIAPEAIRAMRDAAARAGRHETGGIIIGRYGPEGWAADVVEATPKPKGSRSGWFWFQRSDAGLSALLEERWRDRLHYLGEWHFHPGGSPKPSGADLAAMWKVAGDGMYRCPAPILVILGGDPDGSWKVSATLFRDGSVIGLSRQSR